MTEKSSTVGHILVVGNAAFPGNGTQILSTSDKNTHGQPTAARNDERRARGG
jgi:hypothetical protein